MTDYILIDSETRQPVPLPFYTSYTRADNSEVRPAKITDFTPPRPNQVKQFRERGLITVYYDQGPPHYGIDPGEFGLELITEADFMAERSDD